MLIRRTPCAARRARLHPRLAGVGPLLLIGLVLGVSLGAALDPDPVVAPPAPPAPVASAHDFAQPIFSANARADIATIGNVSTTCDPRYENEHWSRAASTAACLGSLAGRTGLTRYDGAPMPPINNRLSMVHVDVDDDPTTFSSSSAQLHVPEGGVVLWAGLHWNAATDVPEAEQLYGSTYEVPPPSEADRFRVRFATPATDGYVQLDASAADGTETDRWDDTNPGGTASYGGFVDVTELVAEGRSGTYLVADVQSCQGFGGCFGSWSLTAVVAHADEPPRNLNVWHGWQLTTPTVDDGTQEFTVTGLEPPPSGPVRARIGVVQADGDRSLGPDSLDISSPSSPTWTTFRTVDRPLAPGEDDWFNSTVNAFGHRRADTEATPNVASNLNQDLALVEDQGVIGKDDTSFSFRTQTAGTESLYSQVVHSAVDLHAPTIHVDKSVAPAGPVAVGDQVTWTLAVRNVGIDPIRAATVVDPLPEGVELVPGSVRYVAGGPAELLGDKTEAPGDDQVDWDPGERTLTMRVGAGADASDGGTMAVTPADDGSDAVTITFRTTVTAAPGTALTNLAAASGLGRTLDDPFGPLRTAHEDPADVATSSDPAPTTTTSAAPVPPASTTTSTTAAPPSTTAAVVTTTAVSAPPGPSGPTDPPRPPPEDPPISRRPRPDRPLARTGWPAAALASTGLALLGGGAVVLRGRRRIR